MTPQHPRATSQAQITSINEVNIIKEPLKEVALHKEEEEEHPSNQKICIASSMVKGLVIHLRCVPK